jgi:hypothetical protein
MGERSGKYKFWRENVKERNNLEDLRVYGRVILKWTFKQ